MTLLMAVSRSRSLYFQANLFHCFANALINHEGAALSQRSVTSHLAEASFETDRQRKLADGLKTTDLELSREFMIH